MAGVRLEMAGPKEFSPLQQYLEMSGNLGAQAKYFEEPQQAVDGADAIYADTWVSMGTRKRGQKGCGRSKAIWWTRK